MSMGRYDRDGRPMSDISKTTRLSDYEVGGAVALSVINVCPHHRTSVAAVREYVWQEGIEDMITVGLVVLLGGTLAVRWWLR